MPGSLLEPLISRGGHQGPNLKSSVGGGGNSSARSDRSDGGSVYSGCSEGGSSKKVSFNKAVRVKKYSTPALQLNELSEPKFWFKVHKASPESSLHLTTSPLDLCDPSSLSSLPPTNLSEPLLVDQSNGKSINEQAHSSPNLGDSKTKKARPLSTIIESDLIEAPRSLSPKASNMSRKEDSTKSASRRIINYQPYKSPPKDATIMISAEDDGYRHEWLSPSAAANLTTTNKSSKEMAAISDDNNNVSKIYPPTTAGHNGHVKYGKSTLPPDPVIDYVGGEDAIEREDEGMITVRKETTKMPKFKIKFGAKLKSEPIFPPQKAKDGLKKPPPKANVINYDNRELKDGSKVNRYRLGGKSSPDLSPTRSKSSSPSASPIRSESLTRSRASPNKESMSKSMIESPESARHGLERVEKFSPPSTERLEDICSERSLAAKMEPVATWDSGPMLISDLHNKESSSNYVPGEGTTMSTMEEGSRVWKHKTRRMYEEPIVGKHRTSSLDRRDVGPRQPSSERTKHKESSVRDSEERTSQRAKTDDDKMQITGEKLDELFLKKEADLLGKESEYFPYLDSYMPKMEDKACQCNLKKSKLRKSSPAAVSDEENRSTSYRVIRSAKDGSVSAYSNVPSIDENDKIQGEQEKAYFNQPAKSEVIYSQIDRTKKRAPNEASPHRVTYESDLLNEPVVYDDYSYEASPTRTFKSNTIARDHVKRRSSPSPAPSQRYSERQRSSSPSDLARPNKTVTSSTKNYGFSMKSPLDAPVIKFPSKYPMSHGEVPRSSSSHRASAEPMDDAWSHRNQSNGNPSMAKGNSAVTRKSPKEFRRETQEENMSISDISSDIYSNRLRHQNMAHATDSDDTLTPKSMIKEIDHRKGEISYENANPMGRRSAARKVAYDGQSIASDGSWYKSLGEDYRKVANEPPMERKEFSTLSRVDGRRDLKREYSPVSGRNAYTLDRRHMDHRKRNKRLFSNGGTGSQLGARSDLEADSDRMLTPSMRKYSSNRDLHSDAADFGAPRGGLAAAYRARQRRASSLNRYGTESELMYPRVHHVPMVYGSHSQLNRLHSENLDPMARSYHGSRTRLYQNEPISLYIPAISHQNKRAEEDERSSGLGIARTQSILSLNRGSKSGGSKLGLKKSKVKGSNASLNEITSKVNGYLKSRPSSDLHDEDEIVELRDGDDSIKKSKKLVKRSQSIPKDAKLPWLQKLRMKVKS